MIPARKRVRDEGFPESDCEEANYDGDDEAETEEEKEEDKEETLETQSSKSVARSPKPFTSALSSEKTSESRIKKDKKDIRSKLKQEKVEQYPTDEQVEAVSSQLTVRVTNLGKNKHLESVIERLTARVEEEKQNKKRKTVTLKYDTASHLTKFVEEKWDAKAVLKSPKRSRFGECPKCVLLKAAAAKRLEEIRKNQPKIAFLGLSQENEKLAEAVVKLGGELVHTAEECTVLVCVKVMRKEKFYCAIGLGKLIVSPQWIEDSIAARKFVDPERYIPRNEAKEALHNFNLRETVQRARERKLYEGYRFYMMAHFSLSEKKIEEMERIVTTFGGVVCKRTQDILPNTIIISDQQTLPQAKKLVDDQYPECSVHSIEFIKTGLLWQRVDLETFAL